MSYVCTTMLHQFYIFENMVILNEPAIETCYYNIANTNKNYEWDIIGIYKIFDSLIQSVDYSINLCACSYCTYGDDEYRYQHVKDVKVYIYIMEFMKTITDTLIEDNVINFINSEEGKPLAERIDEYYNFLDRFDILPDKERWKNKEWYYQRIFRIPWILKRIGVPIEHYQFRKYYYFEDRIAGHPKSLCGWAKEGLIDTEAMGALSF